MSVLANLPLAALEFLDDLPEPMTEWWFIPASILCLLTIVLAVLLLVIITVVKSVNASRNDPRYRD